MLSQLALRSAPPLGAHLSLAAVAQHVRLLSPLPRSFFSAGALEAASRAAGFSTVAAHCCFRFTSRRRVAEGTAGRSRKARPLHCRQSLSLELLSPPRHSSCRGSALAGSIILFNRLSPRCHRQGHRVPLAKGAATLLVVSPVAIAGAAVAAMLFVL